MKQNMELLAPAGGREQLVAAVACGADAVYLGAGAFNARRSADNFDGDALQEAVRYCHARGVKVHLALNTLVLEREMPSAMELAGTACEVGVDAMIVQDLGLVRLLRRAAPSMPLHGSTQMSIHNLAGARALEAMGISRVVLAREMSREEIQKVARGTALETEVFVHGALCMCLSGQCYMSSLIGERSGNRGLCAQPCRLPFYVKDPARCGLSLKDMSLVEYWKDLEEIGVTSAKIEGRMKRPEYVAAAVTACKNAREGLPVDAETLRAVFSRSGFTDGYYTGRLGSGMFGTRQKEDVTAAAGTLKDLEKLYAKETPRVPLEARFTMAAGQPLFLVLKDPEGREVRAEGEAPEAALSRPTTAEMALQNLSKLGGTPYFLKDPILRVEDGLMAPVSRLNLLRREAVEALTALREQPAAVPFAAPQSYDFPKMLLLRRPLLRGRFAKAEQIPQSAWEALERVILPVGEALELPQGGFAPEKAAVELPRMMFDEEAVRPLLQKARERGITRAVAGNLGAVTLAREEGFAVSGDFGLNAGNSFSLETLRDLGVEDATLSFELNLQNAVCLGDVMPLGLLGYGHLPMMAVRNCPVKAEVGCVGCKGFPQLYDRRKNGFYVSCGGARQGAELYNHLPLYLADRLRELNGFSFLTLYFTMETREKCAGILEEYQTGGKRENITRGLYYRTLK
ncbi:MAG: DUF3656 domain-containing protein [Oscillospiraceae bacterium]|nr:DUF3656 domain-containing protein [Oscillospiraceae bacterium]